jgi:hypothetical protein
LNAGHVTGVRFISLHHFDFIGVYWVGGRWQHIHRPYKWELELNVGTCSRHYCFITTNALDFPMIPPGKVKHVAVLLAVIGLLAAVQELGAVRLEFVSTV